MLELIRSYPETADAVVTLGLNYRSTKLGRKDMLKLSLDEVPDALLHVLSLVSPGITVKKIEAFRVAKKYGLEPPEEIVGIVRCRNPNCVTNTERQVRSRFVRLAGSGTSFRCGYCERVFALAELEVILP